MPLIERSSYHPPVYLRNPHVQSMLPQLFRKVRGVQFNRERITTPDDDFMDIDWSKTGAARCAILFHGLEGHTQRSYMRGMSQALGRDGWDVAAVNLRGCSGEPNRLPKSYHQGSSDDCATVIGHVSRLQYQCIVLVGFSLGGNIILKYLGEPEWRKPSSLRAGVAISAQCDLPSCADKMMLPQNRLYTRRFIKMLLDKLVAKRKLMPDVINLDGADSITTFEQFDTRFTAPLNGFSGPADYYTHAASLPFLSSITLPALMINACDDPFLTPACFPDDIARDHPSLYLEAPRFGGHVGFMGQSCDGAYWHERRTVFFLKEVCG